jgi:hypothetical protein
MNERELQRTVTEALTLYGWRWLHMKPARTPDGKYLTRQDGHPGFPDLVAVRGGVLRFDELKGDGGRPSAEQQEWAAALSRVTEVRHGFVWPRDLDALLEELR